MIQINVLSIWSGKIENVRLAQEQLLKRANANGAAAKGEYQGGVNSAAAGQSLFEANRNY